MAIWSEVRNNSRLQLGLWGGGEVVKSRVIAVAALVILSTVAVLAAVDIPTRYSGAFPSTANIQRISGTFTGKSLTLKGVAGKQGLPVTGSYSCSQQSATQTTCSGSIKFAEGNRGDRRHILTITWQAGRPISMSGQH